MVRKNYKKYFNYPPWINRKEKLYKKYRMILMKEYKMQWRLFAEAEANAFNYDVGHSRHP